MAALLLVANPAAGLLLIDDDFTGATGNPNDMGYFMAARITNPPDGPVSTLAFQNDELRFVIPTQTGDDNQGIFIHFPETTLADGESLRLTLAIGSAALGSTTSQFQLTFANTSQTFTENVATNSWTNFTTYSTWIGAGGTNTSRIRSGSPSGTTYLASSTLYGPSASDAVAGSNRVIVFEVLRVNEEDHRLFVSIDDTVLWNFEQAPHDFSTFNTLGIAVRSAGGTVERNFGLESITLEVIPEPAMASLLLLSAGLFLTRRRI